MSAWLHNMSVPPRSTLSVARQVLPGRRFRVRFQPEWSRYEECSGPCLGDTPLAWALEGGVPRALALLERNASDPIYDRDATAARAEALAAHVDPALLAQAIERLLRAAAIPTALGVFVDADQPGVGDVPLDAGTALAVLVRRSGPLYVPTRMPQLSLVVPCQTTLVFPLEDDHDR